MKNKTVIVTGGSRGIGNIIAKAFAAEGANIVLNDIAEIDQAVINEIKGFGVDCLAIVADIRNFEQAKNLIAAAKETFSSVDVLVNNAGITRDNLLLRMTEDEFDSVISVNLKGSFNTIRHVTPVMLKQKSGCIINISSIVGIMGNAGQANYSASKAGLIGLTKTTARELAARGITCNAIAPGFIQTKMTDALSEEVKEKYLSSIPLGRFGTPEDVASAAVFFAKNTYVTGQVLSVCGGFCM